MAKSIQFINQFDAHKLKNLITILYKFRITDVHKLNNQSSELINTHST